MKKADGSRYSPSDFAPNKRIVIASFVFELLVPELHAQVV